MVADPGQAVKVGLGPARWALLGAALIALAALVWHADRLLRLQAAKPEGPTTVYDLSSLTLPRDQVVVAAPPGAIPRLREGPPTLSREEAEERRLGRGKMLVSGEPVIGVVLGGEARAYPLRLLDFHEVVNDVVGDVPVAITWHPLTACARVFERRVAGSRLELVASGVLADSGLLLGDATRDPPSLYSQLLARAVAGPAAAAGEHLTPVPFVLQRWADWSAAHPETRVLKPAEEMLRLYKREPYRSYRGHDELKFPAAPLPPPELGLPRKAMVLAVEVGGVRRVYPLALIAERAGEDGLWTTEQGGVPLELRVWEPHQAGALPLATARAPGGQPLEAIPCFWFAWYAAHEGQVELVR